MQWVRHELASKNQKYDQLIGIRYFSCASNRTSDLGFNYVFPTSGKQDRGLPFCSVLMKAFKLTNPVFIHEFENCVSRSENRSCTGFEPHLRRSFNRTRIS